MIIVYNIFSNLPLDTMIRFHVRKNLKSFLEDVELFMQRYIPLFIENEMNVAFPSPRELRKFLQSRVKDAKPAKIAELTTILCKNYLDFWNHLDKNHFSILADNLMTMVPTRRSLFLDMAEFFWDGIYNKKEIDEEIVQFLVLSHYYTHTHTTEDDAILDKKEWSCIINNENPESGTMIKTIPDKIASFCEKDPLFPYAFLISNNQREKHGGEKFWLRTIIDMPVLTGILYSTAFSKNPFIINKRTISEARKLNMENFLKLFNGFFTSDPNEGSIIFNNYKSEVYSSKVAFIFDQYILERLAGINFINCLYIIKRSSILPDQIINEMESFILSPLPNFRFLLLKAHEGDVAKEFERHPEFISPWIIFLDKIMKFNVFCSLPIMDFVFHYLMALQSIEQKDYNKDYSEHYLTNMMNYISALSQSGIYSFYAKDDDGNLTPQKYPFLFRNSNLDSIYAERCPALYLLFFDKIIQMRFNNFLSRNSINRYNLALADSAIFFLTNTLPSISDIVTQ